MWLAVLNRLSIANYLHRRHIRPLSSCVLCGNQSESSAHIFLYCPFALRVWAPFTYRLNPSSWPASLRYMWEDWRLTRTPNAIRKFWDSCFHAVIWSIWLERYARNFTRKKHSAEEVSHRALFYVVSGGRTLYDTDCIFFFRFVLLFPVFSLVFFPLRLTFPLSMSIN